MAVATHLENQEHTKASAVTLCLHVSHYAKGVERQSYPGVQPDLVALSPLFHKREMLVRELYVRYAVWRAP